MSERLSVICFEGGGGFLFLRLNSIAKVNEFQNNNLLILLKEHKLCTIQLHIFSFCINVSNNNDQMPTNVAKASKMGRNIPKILYIVELHINIIRSKMWQSIQNKFFV